MALHQVTDTEVIAVHFGVSIDEAKVLLRAYSAGELLSGVPVITTGASAAPAETSVVGTTVDELATALALMEKSIPVGGKLKVELCSNRMSSQEDLADFYLKMVAGGMNPSYPDAQLIEAIPTTTFVLEKAPPAPQEYPLATGQFVAIAAILPTLFIVGLIAFGITQISNISSALMPILITVVIGAVALAIILTRPAKKLATAHLPPGAQQFLPRNLSRRDFFMRECLKTKSMKECALEYNQKAGGFMPSTIPIDNMPQTELRDKVREVWIKATEWEHIPPDSKFVVFSEDNPYNQEYAEAVGKLLRFQQVQAGEYQSETLSDYSQHLSELMGKLTANDLDSVFSRLDMEIDFRERPFWDRYQPKTKNMESVIKWAKNNPQAKGLPVMLELLEKRASEKAQYPVTGPVPGTRYLKWSDFTRLPSYPNIAVAVDYCDDYRRKCSPQTKDGYVSVDAIYNMSAWANWKSSSLGDTERRIANAIDEQLQLGALMRLNHGRRMDQPALFPEHLLPATIEGPYKPFPGGVPWLLRLLVSNKKELGEQTLRSHVGDAAFDQAYEMGFITISPKHMVTFTPKATQYLDGVAKGKKYVVLTSGPQAGSMIETKSWGTEELGYRARGEPVPSVMYLPENEAMPAEPRYDIDFAQRLQGELTKEFRNPTVLREKMAVANDLRMSVNEEKFAEAVYKDRGIAAINAGDFKTGKLYEHVADEERHHQKEFTDRFKEVGGDKMTFVPDSAEYLSQTIDDSGWREKLDEAFQAAIERTKK